jgi:hypothetical protein
VAATFTLFARRIEMRGGCFDARRAVHAGVDQLVLDGADPAPDVEERRTPLRL